ncbi:hypothetical protein EBN03_08540 [Nocardia stercoris]|uniref:Aminotransferase class I/classII large domain-containing protein n=1 Tax=Nocardia stercoris TaxID=2483361 RepID=A0A3M2L6H7_9NOCA|nr:hypothetical protein EBN03_08540 [Nocardia stercoris]
MRCRSPHFSSGRSAIFSSSPRTFSKAYGLAALRIGYGVAGADLAARIGRWQLPNTTPRWRWGHATGRPAQGSGG